MTKVRLSAWARFAFASFALVAIGGSMAGCPRGGGGGGTLATVAGDKITMDQYHKFLETMPTVRVQISRGSTISPTGEVQATVSGTLGFQAMYELIMRTLLTQMARDENVLPTKADVDAELEFKKKLNPNYMEQQQAGGLSYQQIRDGLTYQLTQERLVTKGVTVTMAEVETYIKEHPEEFTEPDLYDMLWIVTSKKATQELVDKDLKSGQSFSLVANRYSEDENAKKLSGRVPVRDIRSLPENVQKAIQNTPEGRSTPWVAIGGQMAKFHIERKTPSKLMTLTDAQKKSVQRALAIQRGTMGKDINARLQERLTSNLDKIEIQYTPLVDIWKRFKERLMDRQIRERQPETAPGATTAAPNPATQPPATTGK